jgi:hypothetical protein
MVVRPSRDALSGSGGPGPGAGRGLCMTDSDGSTISARLSDDTGVIKIIKWLRPSSQPNERTRDLV